MRAAHHLASITLAAAGLLAATGCAPSTPTGAVSLPAGGCPDTAAATPPPLPAADARAALAVLPCIQIKGPAPKTGYSRDAFGPAWADVDHNGCDTRNDVLRRDLTGVQIKPDTHGCTVTSGTLVSRYTGQTIAFERGARTSSAVQIDHLAALNDAWQTGAQQWSADKRRQLANDPANLLAVDGSSNAQKGGADLATWLPAARGEWCDYVARIVSVKARYGLWMKRAEHDRARQILTTCPTAKG